MSYLLYLLYISQHSMVIHSIFNIQTFADVTLSTNNIFNIQIFNVRHYMDIHLCPTPLIRCMVHRSILIVTRGTDGMGWRHLIYTAPEMVCGLTSLKNVMVSSAISYYSKCHLL